MDDLASIDGVNVVIPEKIKQEPFVELNPQKSDKVVTSLLEEKPDEELLKYGMKFFPPAGWIKKEKISTMGGIKGLLFDHPSDESFIHIGLPSRSYLKEYENFLSQVREDKDVSSEKKIIFLGVTCWTYFRDILIPGRGMTRSKSYHFFKNNLLYSMLIAAESKDFNKYFLVF